MGGTKGLLEPHFDVSGMNHRYERDFLLSAQCRRQYVTLPPLKGMDDRND